MLYTFYEKDKIEHEQNRKQYLPQTQTQLSNTTVIVTVIRNIIMRALPKEDEEI
jgi:hypothetical protein